MHDIFGPEHYLENIHETSSNSDNKNNLGMSEKLLIINANEVQ